MEITIYKLLGLVKDGKAPKKIIYDGTIYEYSENDDFYYCKGFSLYREFVTNGNCLDNEVEIIEEANKIEKISWSEKESLAGEFTASEKQNILARRTEKLKSSLNELIDEVNKLKEE